MTVVFKSPLATEGPLVALKVYGTRNVEISMGALPEWKSFRRVARVYSDALALLDCFQLIEVEPSTPTSLSRVAACASLAECRADARLRGQLAASQSDRRRSGSSLRSMPAA
jgi:hypothetical protein